MGVRVIEVHESVFARNDREAATLRERLAKDGTLLINVMSSPGSGKTTLLTALINKMKKDYTILDMDVDIESTLDAQRVADLTGVGSLQIHNGGLCHIDAEMTAKALDVLAPSDADIIFLENIGNLVCPAEFDTGAHLNMMLLSVPEGDDKPLKYPLMFSVCDLVIISKIDTLEYFDFDCDRAVANIRKLNPNAVIVFASAKTGEGIDGIASYVKNFYDKIIH